MGLAALALDVFGDRVDVGVWMSPVYLDTEGLSTPDLEAGISLLREVFPQLEVHLFGVKVTF
jgi:hypothetical protein